VDEVDEEILEGREGEVPRWRKRHTRGGKG